jgi:hypothetical protein
MTANNPMAKAENREKMAATLKRIKHGPKIRGGNGKGMTLPQRMLSERLGDQFVPEYIQPTRMPRGSGYPAHFKIDLARLDIKLAVEIDGASHGALSRQEQDLRKTNFLTSIGWHVLRFSNRQVTERLEECFQMVMSITSKLKVTTTIS